MGVKIYQHDGERCGWANPADPLYCAYHDEEWGVPEHNARALWEKLVLDGFQAGLAWITILKKRDAFRAAFDDFDPETVARYGAADRARLMADAGIVRSNAKIDAAISGARIYLDRQDRGEDFSEFLWSFVGGRPIEPGRRSLADIPAESDESRAMAKDLRARGGNFVGPTIVYAFMQATGMVNDHLVACCRHDACRALARDVFR